MSATRYHHLVNPSYYAMLRAARLDDPESVLSWSGRGDTVSRSSASRVCRCPLGEMPVYVKRWFYEPASWRYLWRSSRALCEWRNYGILRTWGVACPELVCLAEKRHWGRLRWAILVTREVPGSLNLAGAMARLDSEQSGGLRSKILREVGRTIRLLHDRHFVLRDAKLRNILLVRKGADEFRLCFVDCPRAGYRRFLKGRAVRRDLERLERDVLKTCGREDWESLTQGYSTAS